MPHYDAKQPGSYVLCTGRSKYDFRVNHSFCQRCGACDPVNLERDPVLHFERTAGKSACGRKLPTAGFFTDSESEFSDREGSRCKACWRVVAREQAEEEAAFDKPEAKAAREA